MNGRQKKEDYTEFESRLVSIASSRSARDSQYNSVPKEINNNQKKEEEKEEEKAEEKEEEDDDDDDTIFY